MLAAQPHSVALGIGDDCALLRVSPIDELAITSDMLVEGRHFFVDANPEWLGYKALAVNLSDLAAMGAKPLGFTLALALPEADANWLQSFSKGLFAAAQAFECPLVGGDTTAGPLNICITAFGNVPKGLAIKRSGAQVEDDIWVSGTVGDARLTLAALRHELDLNPQDLEAIQHRMHQPSPRIALGLALRGVAHAALDISDGLLGDLKHLLEGSQKDAEVYLDRLPKSPTLLKQAIHFQNQFAASGGDDYELCFTAPQRLRSKIEEIGRTLQLPLTQIGRIKPMQSERAVLTVLSADGMPIDESQTALLLQSFDHFA